MQRAQLCWVSQERAQQGVFKGESEAGDRDMGDQSLEAEWKDDAPVNHPR